jgi:cell division protein FtsW (lipid II flippase)
MLSLLCAYLCVPRRYRFILRWLAACVFLVVLALVLILFYRVLMTVPNHHGWILHPRSHQPLSPDFIRDRAHRDYRSTEIL